jgi:hypothetical protein
MRRLTRTLELDCDPDSFWQMFFDDDYVKKLHRDGLGFREIEVLERTDTRRRLRAVPSLDVPETVARLLGDRFGYVETGSLDRARGEWRWSMAPNALGDKLRTEGTIVVEAAGDGRARRKDEVIIEAKVFGVGGLIEASAEKQLRASWDREATFLNRWIAKTKTAQSA